MNYDYSKLRGKITEVCKTQENFANLMGLSTRTISLKLNNNIAFDQNEILLAVTVLGLKQSDIEKYFFTKKVEFN